MKRRTFLATVSTGVGLAVSGCLTDESDTEAEPAVADYSFEAMPPAETPDEPAVTDIEADTSAATAEVTIEGTATVKNGCTTLVVGSEPTIDENEDLVVALETREEGDACTQALRDIGYQLVISHEGACPDTVRLTQAGQNQNTVEIAVNCL